MINIVGGGGGRDGSVGSVSDCEPMCCRFESSRGWTFRFPSPVLRDWVIKGLGMFSLVYATGHMKDPVPLIKKRRGLSAGGRFLPSFIHQVIIITGLNKLYKCSYIFLNLNTQSLLQKRYTRHQPVSWYISNNKTAACNYVICNNYYKTESEKMRLMVM